VSSSSVNLGFLIPPVAVRSPRTAGARARVGVAARADSVSLGWVLAGSSLAGASDCGVAVVSFVDTSGADGCWGVWGLGRVVCGGARGANLEFKSSLLPRPRPPRARPRGAYPRCEGPFGATVGGESRGRSCVCTIAVSISDGSSGMISSSKRSSSPRDCEKSSMLLRFRWHGDQRRLRKCPGLTREYNDRFNMESS
jgi:hypothetical protein